MLKAASRSRAPVSAHHFQSAAGFRSYRRIGRPRGDTDRKHRSELRVDEGRARIVATRASESSSDRSGQEAVDASRPSDADAGSPLSDETESALPAWKKGWQLVKKTANLFWTNAWSVLAVFAVCDALVFVVHRLCHRFTNEVAIRLLLPAELGTADAIGGSLWWLSNNPDIANFQTGYQWVVGLVFLVMFPLGILLRTLGTATAHLILTDNLDRTGHPGWRPPVKRIWGDLKVLQRTRAAVTRLWQVDLLVAVRAIPLQGLSLLLLPIPWTLPRLLDLQLAMPASLFQGEHGDGALKASKRLVEPIRKALAVPYIGLLLLPKILAFLGRVFLTNLSPRIARDLPEIPIVAYVSLALATVILNRIQDLLPLVTFIEAHKAQGRQPRLEAVT